MTISLDTETTGLDLYHGASPFFVTTCDELGEQRWWEWRVDPLTRKVYIPASDIQEIRELVEGADSVVFHNSKFDIAMLVKAGLYNRIEDWDWSKVHDTLLAGHLLASSKPHNLTSMAVQYLGISIEEYERNLRTAVTEARRIVRSSRPSWRIAKSGLPEMPSAKQECWRYDTWLPKEVATEMRYPKNHPWHTVLEEYSNVDSAITIALWAAVKSDIERRGLWNVYLERLKCLPVAAEMEARGVTVSKERWDVLDTRYKEESNRLRNVCVNIASSYGYNLSLPKGAVNKSLKTFVFDVLKLPPVYNHKAKTGNPCLDSKHAIPHYLSTLEENSKPLAFIKSLANKRTRDTELSFLELYKRFWKPVTTCGKDGSGHIATTPVTCKCKGIDGRCPTCDYGLTICSNCGKAECELSEPCLNPLFYKLHPNLNPTGTDTLRWSSSNPNSQNIKKSVDFEEGLSLRYMFGPLPDREWWSLDAKNIELRIPFYESGEPEMINLFEKPDEPPYYGSNHLLIFHLLHPDLWDGVEKEVGFEKVGPTCKKRYASSWYRWTKNGNFAQQYGAVEKQDGTGTADLAYHVRGAQSKIKSRFRRLEALNQKCIRFAEEHGYVETIPDKTVDPLRGYPLLCTRIDNGRILPTVPLNYHVQGTAMWWMAKAMVRCHNQLKEWRYNTFNKFDGYLIMQIHDELVFDFPKTKKHPKEDVDPNRPDKCKLVRTFSSSNLWRIRTIQRLMEKGGEDIGIPTPVGCEYHSSNWGEGESI